MIEVVSGKELESLAYRIAADAHYQGMYNFRPYVEHPVEVALLAKKLGYPSEVVSAAYLHDTVEDTKVTPESLLEQGIPLIVVEGVNAVTYTEEDLANEVDKIAKARSNPIGHVTKFCDSSRNFATCVTYPEILELEEPGKARKFALRYSGYLAKLIPDLPTPEFIEDYVRNFQG